MNKIIVAIDGYSACGKSTTAKLVADRLNFVYIDTGAMYRAVTLYFLEHNVNALSKGAIDEALNNIKIDFRTNPSTQRIEVTLNGEFVEDKIRSVKVTDKVSVVSALPQVRKAMVEQQRLLGDDKSLVMDGRDIGTTVFPHADIKIFMQADMDIRAYRRKLELEEKGISTTLDEVKKSIERRDSLDTTRKESPLTKSPDAFVLDTSKMTIDQQVDSVVQRVLKVMNK